MTDIYSGIGWFSKTQVGMCGDGEIYKGYGWGKTQVGCYADGYIIPAMAGVIHRSALMTDQTTAQPPRRCCCSSLARNESGILLFGLKFGGNYA